MLDENIPSEYIDGFDKVIKFSKCISKLYLRLCDAELKYGINSPEYKKIVTFIELSSEYENDKINEIFDDLSVVSIFKQYLTICECKRLSERCKSDYQLSELLFYSKANDKYDDLIENDKIDISRDVFLQQEYDGYGKKILESNVFNLLFSKNYIRLLDDYISNIDDRDIKRQLIYEKNLTLASNKDLESWYFNFEKTNMQGMLVESDIIVSDELDIPLENYINLKNNYFLSLSSDYIDLLLKSDNDPMIVKIIYELNLLAVLLSMNANSVLGSYKIFNDEVEVNSYLYDKTSIDYVESIFGKTVSLSKKLTPKYPSEEDM